MRIPEIIHWSSLPEQQREAVLQRPSQELGDLQVRVAEIIEAVRLEGDRALREFTQRFDKATVDRFEIPEQTLAKAKSAVDPALMSAIGRASGRIRAFHQASRPSPVSLETADGLVCSARYLPISPVGLYVPGGTAPLVSTVMMLAIPAAIAGCPEVVLCTPPDGDGNLNPALLAAARACGVSRVFRAGGAQAIAAMAFGTESIPACAKLFGPGNAWVTEAKRQVASLPGGAAQDLPAGPSEVLLIADAGADPAAVAWDLLSQSEHGPDSQSLLLSESRELLERVSEILPDLARDLPRAAILEQSLAGLRLIEVGSTSEAIGISNRYAPEHLIINTAEAEELLERVTAAGSVFLGPWTPESLGDYSSGTNHVLPTYGYANAHGGLSVADFQRRMTVQKADQTGLAEAGADAMALAAAEGLEAHRMAVAYRLEKDAGGTT
jgi:histidinol dehydrogenase